MPSTMPQLANGSGPVATFTLENSGKALLQGGVATLGHVFLQGDVPQGAGLTATIGGQAVALQMDIKSTWPDGSARMTVLSVARPDLAAGAHADVVLHGAAAPSGAPPIDLARAADGHSFTVDMDIAGRGAIRVDVLAELKAALAAGKASFWQQGELATQARVEIPLEGAQRLLFDVTLYRGGGMEVEATFANDGAMGATGGRVAYGVTVTMDGAVVASEQVSQGQYQNWHRTFGNDHDGGQGLGSRDAGWLNVRHDVSYLEASRAVADYDPQITVNPGVTARWEKAQLADGWGDPLAANGVTKYMPTSGGREDIGTTTAANSAWLMTGDPRVAGYALGQAEAAGSIPWHYWDAANSTWLNTGDYPKLWTDARGGTGKPGDPASKGLTQPVPGDTGWGLDRSHQPDLSYVPYLLTGERWILDNLQAQGSYNVVSGWPAMRTESNDNVVQGNQVRGSAWSLREVDNALWASVDGTPEQAWLKSVSEANWKWLVDQIPAWTEQQGEAHGWIPATNGVSGTNNIAPWQQDYFASTAIAAAGRGNEDAMTVLNWMSNFLVGRFQQADNGFAMHDGSAYSITMGNTSQGVIYKTWAEVGAATVANGLSNGDGWAKSEGSYSKGALHTLASIYHLTGSEEAREVYAALLAERPMFTSQQGYASGPQEAISIPSVYKELMWGAPLPPPPKGTSMPPAPPPAGADEVRILNEHARGETIDMGDGLDRLVLFQPGPNKATVLNAETVTGGTGTDTVTLAGSFRGVEVDLGGGVDRLVLGSPDGGSVTVRNTEAVVGGAGSDTVTLHAAPGGTNVDLKGGSDTLYLEGGGTVHAWNVETVLGGSGDDVLHLRTPLLDGIVNLGGGVDRLVLESGTNRISLSGVETVRGGTGADLLTLEGAYGDVALDLGAGRDTLTLATAGMGGTVRVAGVELVLGSGGRDTVTASGATPVRLEGRGGDDVLTGGAGADVLIGGAGADILRGGAGADRFVYTSVGESAVGRGDTVADFQHGVDVLVFQGLERGDFVYRGAAGFTATGHSEASFADATSSQLLVDRNGDGRADMEIQMTGITASGISASDFVWS